MSLFQHDLPLFRSPPTEASPLTLLPVNPRFVSSCIVLGLEEECRASGQSAFVYHMRVPHDQPPSAPSPHLSRHVRSTSRDSAPCPRGSHIVHPQESQHQRRALTLNEWPHHRRDDLPHLRERGPRTRWVACVTSTPVSLGWLAAHVLQVDVLEQAFASPLSLLCEMEQTGCTAAMPEGGYAQCLGLL